MTVFSSALMPLAILSSFKTLAILRTLMTLIIVGLIIKVFPSISSRPTPIMERTAMATSS